MPESAAGAAEYDVDRITDPAIAEFKSNMDDNLAMAGRFAEHIRDVAATVFDYRQRNGVVEGLSADVLVRPGVAELLTEIGAAALEVSTEDVPTPTIHLSRDKLSENLGTLPMSRLSRQAYRLIEPDRQGNGRQKDLLERAYQLGIELDSTEVSASAEGTRAVLRPVHELSDAVYLFRKADPEGEPLAGMQQFARAIQGLPTQATINCIAGLAFIDTIRGLRGKGIKGTYTPENRRAILEHGVEAPHIVLFEAARILDLASLAITETGNTDIMRHHILANTVGLSKIKAIAMARHTDLAASRVLTPHARLIVNAHEVMVAMNKALVQRDYLAHMLGGKEPQMLSILRAACLDQSDLMAEINKIFYDAAPDLVTSEDTAEQMLLLEEYKNSRLRELAASIADLGLLRRDELRSMEGFIESRLRQQKERQAFENELAVLREFIDAKIAELDVIDRPYRYTAKGIRTYEGGPELLRDLDRELESKELLPAMEILQTLSMLILQSEHAADKEHYFQQVIESRFAIEQLLADLEYVGAADQYRSQLASTLRWIDEFLDSGQDDKITNSRFQDFLCDYYLGPGVEPINGEDESLPHEDEAEQPKSADDTLDTSHIEQYIATLADILKDESIVHADVNVFPPGKLERQRKEGARRDVLTFVDVDPKRLENLVRLKKSLEAQGRAAQLMATNYTGWEALPYFVLFVRDDAEGNKGVCLLENPVNGNATYVFNVDGNIVRSWPEIARLTKQEAREFGAVPFVHPAKGASNFNQHYDLKLMSHISLSLVQLRS